MQGEGTYAKGSFVLVFTSSFKGSEKDSHGSSVESSSHDGASRNVLGRWRAA